LSAGVRSTMAGVFNAIAANTPAMVDLTPALKRKVGL